MKTIFTTIGILHILIGFSQNGNEKIILKKEKHGEVYITHDTSRIEYTWLIPDYPKEASLDLYNQYYQAIVKDTTFTKYNSQKKILPVKWTPLNKIDDQYYLYAPSDWISSYGYIFSDSTIIKQYTDGPDVYVLLSTKKISNNRYEYKTLASDKSFITINVYIIDNKNHIAVWRFDSNNETTYGLLVDADYLKRFPLVVSDCYGNKCIIEYNFKPIDFEKLIKNIQ
jgi:hypothetical protein